jgi:polysaccharide biosynthesis transport protein
MNKQPVAIRPELISSDISAVVCNASISAFTTIIARQKWKIVGMTLMSGLSVAALFSRLAPLYEGTAEISIDRSGALGVVGPEASAIAPGNDMDQLLTTDVETLQSDAILRPVTQQFKLLEEEGQLAGI